MLIFPSFHQSKWCEKFDRTRQTVRQWGAYRHDVFSWMGGGGTRRLVPKWRLYIPSWIALKNHDNFDRFYHLCVSVIPPNFQTKTNTNIQDSFRGNIHLYTCLCTMFFFWFRNVNFDSIPKTQILATGIYNNSPHYLHWVCCLTPSLTNVFTRALISFQFYSY